MTYALDYAIIISTKGQEPSKKGSNPMKFAFEVAHNVAIQREHLLHEMVDKTIACAELAFDLAEKEGEYNVVIEIPACEEHPHLRAEYEEKVVTYFESYGYLIAYIAPWKWFISCDPSQWESE